MKPTESTPLTQTASSSVTYAFIQGRKNRLRQYQCCLCAILFALIVTLAVVIVSYSVADDLEDAVDAGSNGLADRDRLEDNTTKLLLSTASFKHQKAVATTAKAVSLSRAGYAKHIASAHLSRKRKRKYNGSIPMENHCGDELKRLIINAGWSKDLNCDDGPVSCDVHTRYRSYGGSCNNLHHPSKWGVAFTAFRRSLPAWYSDGIGKPRTTSRDQPLPQATTVSSQVHRPLYRNDPKFTVMLAVWGQFLDHDITATAASRNRNGSPIACCSQNRPNHPECFSVIEEISGRCMEFVRSAPAADCCLGPRNQINQASSYIDGSMIYGSEKELSDKLRKFQNGSLKMLTTPDGRELLPASDDLNDGCNRIDMNKQGKYCFLSGDPRSNENLHLTTMHLLLARNHNNIAAELRKHNPQWDDEKLFQETRRIIGAQTQHVTYKEFLPIVLGSYIMNKYDLNVDDPDYKYNETIDPSIANEFAAAAFRFAHTLIPGLMKLLANDTSSPQYVQLHRMLFDPYILYEPGRLDIVIRGAINTSIEAADTYFTDELKSKLFQNDSETKQNDGTHCGGLDLVALNIQRGRDHGLAGYVDWRKHCGLSIPETFTELSEYMDTDSVQRISDLYVEVEDVDLYTGALSERPIQGSLLGPTASCLIVDQFIRLKRGDRFWYENLDGPQSFTPGQLDEIKKTSLASIICDTSDDIRSITPLVMKRDDVTNRNVPCTDINRPDFIKWKQ